MSGPTCSRITYLLIIFTSADQLALDVGVAGVRNQSPEGTWLSPCRRRAEGSQNIPPTQRGNSRSDLRHGPAGRLPPVSHALAATLVSSFGARPLGWCGRPPRLCPLGCAGNGDGTAVGSGPGHGAAGYARPPASGRYDAPAPRYDSRPTRSGGHDPSQGG